MFLGLFLRVRPFLSFLSDIKYRLLKVHKAYGTISQVFVSQIRSFTLEAAAFVLL